MQRPAAVVERVRVCSVTELLRRRTIASKTGITSVVELLMTRRCPRSPSAGSGPPATPRPHLDLLLKPAYDSLQLLGHRVEPAREVLELVAGFHFDAAREVALADLLGARWSARTGPH
jgi:hypothetical protein